jgi:hypothetical protein
MLLVWDGFEPTSSGHGGSHRSQQLWELYGRTELKPFSVSTKSWRPSDVIRSCWDLPLLLRQLPRGFRSFTNTAHAVRLNAVTRNSPVNIIACEKFYWSPWVLSLSYRSPIVCIPHNIEAFVPEQKNALRRDDPADAAAELALFQEMDACFCICPEDTAIVRAVNPRTYTLPYYPCNELAHELLSIRNERENNASQDSFFLMLGTAGNGPTLRGMQEFLRAIIDSKIKIIVAGFGTEVLQPEFGDKAQVLGAVSQQELRQLLINARCLLVNHSPTTGCLTRIVDCLIAGVPILANSYALRGQALHSGIHSFNTPTDGLRIASSTDFKTPPIPARPVVEEEFFVTTMKSLATANNKR